MEEYVTAFLSKSEHVSRLFNAEKPGVYLCGYSPMCSIYPFVSGLHPSIHHVSLLLLPQCNLPAN